MLVSCWLNNHGKVDEQFQELDGSEKKRSSSLFNTGSQLRCALCVHLQIVHISALQCMCVCASVVHVFVCLLLQCVCMCENLIYEFKKEGPGLVLQAFDTRYFGS